jgi:hypothetical protein
MTFSLLLVANGALLFDIIPTKLELAGYTVLKLNPPVVEKLSAPSQLYSTPYNYRLVSSFAIYNSRFK